VNFKINFSHRGNGVFLFAVNRDSECNPRGLPRG